MRNLILVVSLIFIFDLSAFAQTTPQTTSPQPVRIVNFGTATRDEMRKVGRSLEVIKGDIQVIKEVNVEQGYDGIKELKKQTDLLTQLNVKQLETNSRLLSLNSSRWTAPEVIITGLLFLIVLTIILGLLAEYYLRPNLTQVPPATPPVQVGSSTQHSDPADLSSQSSVHPLQIEGGAHDLHRSTVVTDNTAPVTITINNDYSNRTTKSYTTILNVCEFEDEEKVKP